MAQQLSKEQQLTKCRRCGDPSVLEIRIAQCTKPSCMYIWCVKCLSGSTRGPDHFVCLCEKGSTPPRPYRASPTRTSSESRIGPSLLQSLGDISNLSFPRRLELDVTAADHFSSGYFSQSDADDASTANLNVSGSRCPLSTSNRWEEVAKPKPQPPRLEMAYRSFHDVAEICMKKRLHKQRNVEPSSPPAVRTNVIGSEKSKKSLRRLYL